MSSSTLDPSTGRRARIQSAFRWACGLDVAVRKPGNVSLASPGTGPSPGQLLDSANAAAGPLTNHGASIGARIEGAIQAGREATGCSPNLGIVLLCAPLAAAAEQRADTHGPSGLRHGLEMLLGRLDADDAVAAFRAIAQADPDGLGRTDERGLVRPAGMTLRAAMASAAPRDRIALQYTDAYHEMFELGLPVFLSAMGTVPVSPQIRAGGLPTLNSALEHAMQRTFLRWLSTGPDSHLVRQHGPERALSVNLQARGWRMRLPAPHHAPEPAEWARWDEMLKTRDLNPQTSAHLCVATAFLAALLNL
ncbi:ATP:dephospho-CoA triphosphoribosyl transferase [Leptothrix cholodnii SP-6]|uniref:ATP:dephospho-CoA triphosphoribosyl transferase n=1 Tax=Leptothrix cholodnii (strain ATCC 51168 / LMG 8142 / SP-6) TaxID=395495 RepID=B1XZT1_LEPCP|nr:triphosphoribosyl-dephospho-CoA synthase [Leptothrix cholodnii]ACB32927.1 ATP:dephospho-CoA triphosphoribosyl transferase [Leptothrix cholodnii SP-6]